MRKRAAKVEQLAAGVTLSLSQLAGEFGSSRETIKRRLDAANVGPVGTRGGHPVYRLRDAIGPLTSDPDAGIDPDRLDPLKRKAHYQAELDKLRLQTERGEVIPVIEVEARFGAFTGLVVRWLDTILDVLERDAGMTPQQAAKFDESLSRLRAELAEMIDADAAAAEAAA